MDDYDSGNFVSTTQSADELIEYVLKKTYTVTMLLDRHARGDHLSTSYYNQHTLWSRGQPHPPVCFGEDVRVVLSHFDQEYHIPSEDIENDFDHQLWRRGQHCHPPPRTYTGSWGDRSDFSGGDAQQLFRSTKRFLAFPSETKTCTGHDYPSSNEYTARGPLPYVTVGEQERKNKHVKNDSTEDDFVKWRTEPKLMHQGMQVNVRGGKMPGKSL
ncbi:hypothetical protein PENCOP_c002G04416 [Penicillium coprophilum]|uniref:Uncharacterized protein n=1 Tax=Penicillium coprophilum TaxID=36646 RepID=A0A1V6V2A4_9EURO|nr:hypothetical protein PENCOP_c002G04416 [Penicillium coprophilum]